MKSGRDITALFIYIMRDPRTIYTGIVSHILIREIIHIKVSLEYFLINQNTRGDGKHLDD